MGADGKPRGWRRVVIIIGAIVIVAGAGIALVNPGITRYVESDAFRAQLEKQTAKGLHFPATICAHPADGILIRGERRVPGAERAER